MEWLPGNLKIVIPLWQLLALLGGLTLCVLARKSIGMVIIVFGFAMNWAFWQAPKVAQTDGQGHTLMAVFFVLGLACALGIAWHLYKQDHYD